MYQYIFLVLTLFSTNQAVQYEQNFDNSIHWAPEPFHILHAGSGVPRSVDTKIKFSFKFYQIPEIALGTILLDWDKGQPAGFNLEVIEKTQEDFTIRYTATTPRMIYGIELLWAAFNDPNIQVLNYQSSNIGELNSGVNKERSQLAVIHFNQKLEEVPQVATFITGVQFTNGNNAIKTQLYEVKKDCATIQVGTYYTTKLEYYQLTLIIGTSKYLYTGELNYVVPNYEVPIAKLYQYTERLVEIEDEITDINFQTGKIFPFLGYSMYDVEDYEFHRLVVTLFEYNKKSIKISVGTWWDSALFGVGLNYILYKPDLTVKPQQPGCVEIFSECGYRGDSVVVCDKIISLPEFGWNKPVKSFIVPEKKVLKLYNKENLNGESLRYDQSQECLENPRFTFAQMFEMGH